MGSLTRRPRANGDATKNNIADQLLSAVESLADEGVSFTSLSIQRLATTAGVSRATFYLHFRDKGDLVTQLLERVRNEIFATTGSWYAEDTAPARPQLTNAIEQFLESLNRHRAILIAISETSIYDPAVKAIMDKMVGDIGAQSAAEFEQMQRSGQANPGASRQSVEVLSWMLYHAGLNYVGGSGEVDIRKLAETLSQIIRASLFAHHAAAGK